MEEKNVFVELFGQFGNLYPCKYNPVGEPWGYDANQLPYVVNCVVVQGDYGRTLRVDLLGMGCQFVTLSTQSKLQIGDVVKPEDVRFIKLVKPDEPDPSKRTIIRVL